MRKDIPRLKSGNVSLPVYAINLLRSRARCEQLKSTAETFSINLRRVEAVEGGLLQPDEMDNFDKVGFRRCHGKVALPAEIGCYFSYIRALESIAVAGEPFAVIVEDDVVFGSGFLPFITKLTDFSGWDVVKLVNHRTAAFRSFIRDIDNGICIGRCLHGPMGSSAAYVVTREGAWKLVGALRRMRLPLEVALERGWAGGYEIFTTDKPLVSFAEDTVSTIAQGRRAYVSRRLPPYKRLMTLLFRATEYVRRIAYALGRKQIGRAVD